MAYVKKKQPTTYSFHYMDHKLSSLKGDELRQEQQRWLTVMEQQHKRLMRRKVELLDTELSISFLRHHLGMESLHTEKNERINRKRREERAKQ